jgi:hypothetical protein
MLEGWCGPVPILGYRARQIVGLFRATGDAWLTTSDIAIWIYGDDSPADCRSVRLALGRLRCLGVAFEWRYATWARALHGQVRAYRLAEQPQEVAA